MTKFIVFTVVINLIAMIASVYAANRANKKEIKKYLNRDPGEVKRGRRPW